MDSNTHSGRPDWLTALEAAVDGLAAQDLAGRPDAARAEGVLVLRRLLDRLEGLWLGEVAAVDARGAAGAEQGLQALSTAGWLLGRLRMGAGAAAGCVRTARALFRGPLTGTAKALTDGELSAAHATVLAYGTHDLPVHTAAEAEPVLLEVARRLDPPRLRRVVTHLRLVADPEGADAQAQRRHQQRGLWLAATLEGMVAVDGLLEPEAGRILQAALEPLARPSGATDERSAGQRRADALAELARRNLESGQLPQTGGVRPQLTVTVDVETLLGRPATPAAKATTPAPWTPRPAAAWPATAPSPASWSPANPLATATTTSATTTATTTMGSVAGAGAATTATAGTAETATATATTTAATPPTTATTTVAIQRPRRGSRPPRPRRGWGLGGPAAGGDGDAPRGPRRGAGPAAGGGPHQPGRVGRPARRPGGPRRRLCVFPAARDLRPGARPIICATGCMAARPT
jgi:hypothetical protein